MATNVKKRKDLAVIVCCCNAIFFGKTSKVGARMRLTGVRQIYYYQHPGGLLAVAETGPAGRSKMSGVGPAIVLGSEERPIACVIEVSSAGERALYEYPVYNS